ncbi:MAG: acyltransferase [Tatlockia sp.]|nr:acyltransferase [Tatlockia sp.]
MPQEHSHLKALKYRPDVDGLRAIAILIVVIFHAFPKIMPGGFIGVDIFFVISGFLISTIIFSNLERDCFSLGDFYKRRIKRLFPALTLVLATSLVFGWFMLFPEEYTQLGKHTVASAGFFQNFNLLRETGYFDTLAETKPLLHFWSLAVEEQFYIFWPLLLIFVSKGQRSFLRITAWIAVFSFAANIYLIKSGRPMAAFYLPFSRFWELMTGSVLAYVLLARPHLIEKHKTIQSCLGFALIIIGLLLLNKESTFPGWWALLPTLGALLILSAGPTSWTNNKLLSNKLMVGLGLISYPLYLWHWPLLSFLHIFKANASNLMKGEVILVAILFAWLTYKFIEKPIRSRKVSKRVVAPLISAMALILVVGEINYQSNIFQRSDQRTEYTKYFDNSLPKWAYYTRENIYKKFRMDCDFYDIDKYKMGQSTLVPRPAISKSCYTRNPAYSHSVLLWGDSHAQHLYYGLKKNLPKDWQILLGVGSGCNPIPDVDAPSTTNFCYQSNWLTLETIKTAKPEVVIVAQVARHSIEQMNLIATKLKDLGVKKIIFMGPIPQWDNFLNKIIANSFWRNTPRRTFFGVNQAIIKENNELVSKFKETKDILFVNLVNFFCNEQGCLTYIGNDKKRGITTFDYAHMAPIASDKLAKEILVNKIIS